MRFLQILSVAIFAFIFTVVQGCGIMNHASVSRRAKEFFSYDKYPEYRDMFLKHFDSLQAGSPFPDWGYACGFHDVGEDTHWEPFQIAAVNYIRAKYPKPWSDDTEKLVTFLMGISSHFIADLNWHGLGEAYPRWAPPRGHGYIKVQGGENFNCNGTLCDASHTAADTGGEFIVGLEFQNDWLAPSWHIPVDDLVSIYSSMNLTVPGKNITDCMLVFYVGAVAISHFGEWIMPKYGSTAPFLLDQMSSFFLGGVTDNAVWTTWRWKLLIDWLEGGAPQAEVTERQTTPEHLLDGQRYQSLFQHLESSSVGDLFDLVSVKRHNGAVKLQLHPDFHSDYKPRKLHQLKAQQPMLQEDVAQQPLESVAPIQVLQGAGLQWEHFGRSVSHGDLDADGTVDMVVGAPGHSQVGSAQLGAAYIFYNGSSTPVVLQGLAEYQRCGHAVAIVDLNQDGIDDLAVGCPTADGPFFVGVYVHDNYRGEVHVYFGRKGQQLQSNQKPDLIINGDDRQQDSTMGLVMIAADVNADGFADLILGSPWAYGGTGRDNQAYGPDPEDDHTLFVARGMVAVILANAALSQKALVNVNDVAFIVRGLDDWEAFGTSLAFLPASASFPQPILAVGSPGFQVGVGRVTGLALSVSGGSISAQTAFVITGGRKLSSFGQSLAFFQPFGDGVMHLAVSAPIESEDSLLHEQCGSVRLYQVASLQPQHYYANNVVTRFIGDQNYGRLGYSLAALTNDPATPFVVSQPLALTFSHGFETGKTFLWKSGSSFPRGDVKWPFLNVWQANGLLHRSKFGLAVHLVSHSQIIVTAPRVTGADKDLNTEAGAAYIFDL